MNNLRRANTWLYLGSESLKSRFMGVPPAQTPVGGLSNYGLVARFSLNNE